jgi:hypothetical protein
VGKSVSRGVRKEIGMGEDATDGSKHCLNRVILEAS